MQKKLIALAVAGLVSAPVFAQSNIQIYGVADAYFKGGKFMGDDTMGVDSGGLAGSRIGFRGEEDLGSGLKAVFVLEQGINIDSGKSTGMTGDDDKNSGDQTFTRQAYVGLKGNFGQVALGRQYAPGYFTGEYDALLNASISPMSLLSNFTNLTITPNAAARWNNSVTYNGTFQSVSLSAIYSAGNRESDSGKRAYQDPNGVWHGVDYSDDDKYGLSLKYDNGPLKVGAMYQAVKYGKDNGLDVYKSLRSSSYKYADKTQHEWLIGASYNFGMATLAGSYQQAKSVEGIDDLDIKLWQVGVIVPVGVGNIHVAYAQAKIDGNNMFTNGWSDGTGLSNEGSQKPKAFTVAYTHGFSKRTTGYLGFAYVDYDDLNWAQAGALGYSADGHYGLSDLSSGKTETIDKTKLFFVGMNHKF